MKKQNRKPSPIAKNHPYQQLIRKEINEYIKTNAGVITKWKATN